MAKRDYYEVLGVPRGRRPGGDKKSLPQTGRQISSGQKPRGQGRRGKFQGTGRGLRGPERPAKARGVRQSIRYLINRQGLVQGCAGHRIKMPQIPGIAIQNVPVVGNTSGGTRFSPCAAAVSPTMESGWVDWIDGAEINSPSVPPPERTPPRTAKADM